MYQFYQPGHEAFQKTTEELKYTFPIAIHGDEGRYLKKGNFMVCTVENLIGNDGDKKLLKGPCTCSEDPVLSRYGNIGTGHTGDESFNRLVQIAAGQHVNDTGNEFLSKFVCFGMSSLVYKKDKALLKKAFEMVADDLMLLHSTGINVGGKTYWAATCGIKGDLKFFHQIGNLTRSYYNTGVKENHPLCSLCLAGHDAVCFEDVSDTPVWQETMFSERPWAEGNAPSLGCVPFQASCPEAIFRLDLFHCYKLGTFVEVP